MKIALDMQARQTIDSRERGIGRYSLSLAKAMLGLDRGHHFTILLNDAFPQGVRQVKEDFGREGNDPNVLVYHTLSRCTEWNADDAWRHQASKILRQSCIASRRFDFVHCSSLFENPTGDASTAWGDVQTEALHGITLYDLIPYAFPDIYLRDPRMRQSYLRKIQELRSADLLLAISEYSRSEAIQRLGVDPVRVVNIAGAADEHFRRIAVDPHVRQDLLQRYGLDRFIMYTGGIDHRKNIERLIQAYAALPFELQDLYQLVIVCKVQESQREVLLKLASSYGLSPGRVVMTGFVSEEDLVHFYNLCDLFVFPSWCEGFGLPVLEAMQCGAPVLAAGTSSLPEVVGNKLALFDPYSVEDMARHMTHALRDAEFRSALIDTGLRQAQRFTWENSARIALEAMEESHARAQNVHSVTTIVAGRRPRLAFVSPLPPSKSGISAYSAQLLPFLEAHYEITLICGSGEVADAYLEANFPIHTPQWLRENAHLFDRVVYQFGNSDHHDYMFRLLAEVPGTVVLHDFWLSNVLEYLQLTGQDNGLWDEHLHYSHGWPALAERVGRGHDLQAITQYPANRKVMDDAVGVILHSQHSAGLASRWYGDAMLSDVRVISSQKARAFNVDKPRSKAKLGLAADEPLFCSFGFVDATKHSLRLAQSFLACKALSDRNARLVFVGQNAGGEYGRQMSELMDQSNGRVSVTGFVSDDDYALYLGAADAAVQLRGLSRGETSAAALDCLAYDVALVINDNGAFAQIPDAAALRLPSEFDDAALTLVLEQLLADPDGLEQRRLAGRDFLERDCHPAVVASRYHAAIEEFHQHHAMGWRLRTVDRLAEFTATVSPLAGDCEQAVAAVEANFPRASSQASLYVDSKLADRLELAGQAVLREKMIAKGDGPRIELLHVSAGHYVNDLANAARIIGTDAVSLPACGIDLQQGDVFLLSAAAASADDRPALGWSRLLRDAAVSDSRVVWYWPEFSSLNSAPEIERAGQDLLWMLPGSSAVIVSEATAARRLFDLMSLAPERLAAGTPKILYAEQPEPADAGTLLALALHADVPNWREMQLPSVSQQVWLATDMALAANGVTADGGCYQALASGGELVFSSLAAQAAGEYVIRLFGAVDLVHEPVHFEILQGRGKGVLAEGVLAQDAWPFGEARFRLSTSALDFQLRFKLGANARMSFRGYHLLPLDPVR